ncbi:MAG: cellulose binding domain-containing protein [Aquabacterium sp.]|uniref:cellulose binding domain-containing protein n=1 Tax=Aquabacterium sp. TaxID=1872578 RepID=UPI0025BB4FF7|nr:cellulose binding domain-containing protein [Aquabacterium sp.]MBI5926798.1 cellulose binding domain-containing protein [Aquabacterium sp.]
MKVAFKSLVAAAAFIAAGSAFAATVNITAGTTIYKGVKLSGNETLSISVDALGFLDILQPTITNTGPAVVTVDKQDNFTHVNVSATAPLTSLALDDTTQETLSASSVGGMTWTVPFKRGLTTGGSITISDLQVDLATKRVLASVTGANGVGTLLNYALWNFNTVESSTVVIPSTPNATAITTFKVSGLQLTTDGITKISTALALSNLGQSALRSILDFGAISTTVTATPAATCSVTFKNTVIPTSTPLFNTEVTVANNSSNPATGWNVNWRYGKPTLLTNIKNAKLTNKYLQNYTAQPLSTNTMIPAGGSTTFSFRGYANSVIPAISDLSATLGGQTCPVVVTP